ncbi:MAG: biotin--[acetyl-CoA-carboxylase] ligase [Candidatus Krumholzibacteriia bacterium]
MAADRGLLPADIQRALSTDSLGRRVYYLPEVDSTNRLAAALAGCGEAEGTLVVTDFQSAGRGRGQNRWISPRGRNLLFSVVLRPRLQTRELLPVTLAFAVTVAEALSRFAGEGLQVKWPNDIVSSGGKIGGLLAESVSKSGRASYVVAGIGVNVNMRAREVPENPGQPVASCHSLTGEEHDRIAVLASLLAALEPAYGRFVKDGFAPFVQSYGERLALRGSTVEMQDGGRGIRGRITGVRDDGGLALRTGDGRERVVYGGRIGGILGDGFR